MISAFLPMNGSATRCKCFTDSLIYHGTFTSTSSSITNGLFSYIHERSRADPPVGERVSSRLVYRGRKEYRFFREISAVSLVTPAIVARVYGHFHFRSNANMHAMQITKAQGNEQQAHFAYIDLSAILSLSVIWSTRRYTDHNTSFR